MRIASASGGRANRGTRCAPDPMSSSPAKRKSTSLARTVFMSLTALRKRAFDVGSLHKKHSSRSVLFLLDRGAYRSRTDDLLTARDNTGFSNGLHYALLQYITIIMNSCFSYILHLFSVWLAKKLADSQPYRNNPMVNQNRKGRGELSVKLYF